MKMDWSRERGDTIAIILFSYESQERTIPVAFNEGEPSSMVGMPVSGQCRISGGARITKNVTTIHARSRPTGGTSRGEPAKQVSRV